MLHFTAEQTKAYTEKWFVQSQISPEDSSQEHTNIMEFWLFGCIINHCCGLNNLFSSWISILGGLSGDSSPLLLWALAGANLKLRSAITWGLIHSFDQQMMLAIAWNLCWDYQWEHLYVTSPCGLSFLTICGQIPTASDWRERDKRKLYYFYDQAMEIIALFLP